MREIWKKRKAAAAKPAAPAKEPVAVGTQVRTMTDALKKTISLKMKEAWKKRKAAAKKAQA
jgi:non-homologous end joining protein Ku